MIRKSAKRFFERDHAQTTEVRRKAGIPARLLGKPDLFCHNRM
jgi:hypothetical protein